MGTSLPARSRILCRWEKEVPQDAGLSMNDSRLDILWLVESLVDEEPLTWGILEKIDIVNGVNDVLGMRRVYAIAVQDLNTKGVLRHRPRAATQDLDFRGLTQTCQRIREEFRPAYLATKSVRIALTDAVSYLETYYPNANASHEVKQVGRLNIILEGKTREDSEANGVLEISYSYPPYDLVPLLKICYVSHDISLLFSEQDGCSMSTSECHKSVKALNKSFATERQAWSGAVQHDLQQAVIESYGYGPWLFLVLKYKTEEQMTVDSKISYATAADEMSPYLTSLGIAEDCGWGDMKFGMKYVGPGSGCCD